MTTKNSLVTTGEAVDGRNRRCPVRDGFSALPWFFREEEIHMLRIPLKSSATNIESTRVSGPWKMRIARRGDMTCNAQALLRHFLLAPLAHGSFGEEDVRAW